MFYDKEMPFYLVFGLIVATLSILFALQNTQIIEVGIFLWEFKGSLALIIFLTLAAGIVSALILSMPAVFRKNTEIKSCRKKIEELQELLKNMKKQNKELGNGSK